MATTVAYPYFTNWFYKPKNSRLLPVSYSDEEISIQSHMIALAGIAINKETILGKSSKSDIKKYSDQLVRFILSHYENEPRALCASIDEYTQSQLLIKE